MSSPTTAVEMTTPTVDRTATGHFRAASSFRLMCSDPANSMNPSIPCRNACCRSIRCDDRPGPLFERRDREPDQDEQQRRRPGRRAIVPDRGRQLEQGVVQVAEHRGQDDQARDQLERGHVRLREPGPVPDRT